MKTQTSSKLILAALAALASTSVAAPVGAIPFRAEAPGDRIADIPTTSAPTVSFRDQSDVMVRSAVAVSAAGVSNDGGFMATPDVGPGNFEKRPYRFTFSLSTGYDDNIYTSSFDKQGSFFTSGSLGFSYKIGDERTTISASLTAGGSYYWDRDDNFDPDISLAFNLTHAFNPKLRLDITSYFAYQAEPDFAIGFGQTRRNGDYIYGNVGFSLSQAFSRRFSTVYSYTVGGIVYNDSDFNDTGDRLEQTFGIQFRYLVQPSLSLVAEYRYGIVTYDSLDRDSTSHYILGGVDYTLNRRLNASIRAGAQIRDADDGGSNSSPFVEANLSYKYAERSSLNWVNTFGYEESDYGLGSVRQSYRTGLSINHSFTPRISANAAGYYSNSTYDGPVGQDEQTLDLNVGASYAFNQLLSLQTGYTYTKVYSDDSFREYDRNRVYLGATLSF